MFFFFIIVMGEGLWFAVKYHILLCIFILIRLYEGMQFFLNTSSNELFCGVKIYLITISS